MFIQYAYAVSTMIPCPLWFWYRWFSASFLLAVFVWSVYNGATYYIDVFGKRFQTELEQLKKDVAKWQTSPDMALPLGEDEGVATPQPVSMGTATSGDGLGGHQRSKSIEQIPLLDGSTGIDAAVAEGVKERR